MPQNGAFGFFHDLAVTDKYYVLLQNPTRLNFRKLLFEYVPGALHAWHASAGCRQLAPSEVFQMAPSLT